jgi:hypothetical protein
VTLKEYLFSQLLTTTARREDVFRTLQNFIADKELEWVKLVGMCTDVSPSMIGIHSRFQVFVKHVALHVNFTHCKL